MKDSWKSGDPYEYYMGRWSSRIAKSFLNWLSPSSGLKWLDVGCGSGALSETVITDQKPAEITALDQSKGFVKTAQKRLGDKASCRVGNALDLPLEDSSVNATVSGLVLNFIPEPVKALAEMKRVTIAGGVVAIYVWDYAGKLEFLNHFWDVAVDLDPSVSNFHEGNRFPDSTADGLKDLFEIAGFAKIETAPIEINTHFRDFEDYWKPFLGGQGPAPSYVMGLKESERSKLRDALSERLSIRADGSIPMAARAWAARGHV